MKNIDGVAISNFDDFAMVGCCAFYIRACDIKECDCTDEEYVEECFSNNRQGLALLG